MEMQVHRARTVFLALRIPDGKPDLDTFRRSKILWNRTSTFCQEMAPKGLTGAELTVLITTVVQDLVPLHLNRLGMYLVKFRRRIKVSGIEHRVKIIVFRGSSRS
jgi:hypothetical protein